MGASSQRRVIAILNQKGGTGKTTTAVNLAAGIAEAGKPTLLVDTDAQGAVGTSLGIRGEKTLADLLVGACEPADCEVFIRENLSIITADNRLLETEASLYNSPEGATAMKKRFAGYKGGEFIIFDCPPTLNILAQLVLNAADEVIIPVSCDYLSSVSIKQIFAAVEKMNSFRRDKIVISGILPTFFDSRNKISFEVLELLEKHFKHILLPKVRINTKLREAPSWRKTIFEYAPNSSGAEDYREVVKAVLKYKRPK